MARRLTAMRERPTEKSSLHDTHTPL
jgi:hypothetical protein